MFELEPTPFSSLPVLQEWAEGERRRRQLFDLALNRWLAEVEIDRAASEARRRMNMHAYMHALEHGGKL